MRLTFLFKKRKVTKEKLGGFAAVAKSLLN
jgi:hypothetical protein